MDHIPAAPESQHPEIPLWADIDSEYRVDYDQLLEFPRLEGWDKALFMSNDFTEESHRRSTREITAFLQMWLYFGVLSAGLELPIKARDFQRQMGDESRRVISTRSLDAHVLKWVRESSGLPWPDKYSRLLRLDKALALIYELLPGVWEGERYRHSLPPELGLSIATLGVYLSFALPQVMGRENLESDIRSGPVRLWGDIWFIGKYMKKRFEGLGWCPNDVLRLSKMVSINALCYFATIPRMESVDHKQCREDLCDANNIDERNYRTKHVKPDCNCCYITSTSEEASLILEDGGIPLISLDLLPVDDGMDPRVEIMKYRPGQRYVAMSHVWSDGLGNVMENSLPQCQMQRLHSLLHELYQLEGHSTDASSRKLVFWIDTLCVPLETKCRKLAIRRMTDTYKNATQVLVLDSELKRTTYRDKPPHEPFARIASSGWMRRVWTLQEGVLASHLFCEFSDGIMDVSSAVREMNEKTNALDIELNMVPVELMSVVGLFQIIRRSQEEDLCRCFVNIWKSIKIRRTSKYGDEIICFAQLLGLDVAEILDINDSDMRMKTCISMLPYVPAGILFTFGPKLEIDGYRWAPRSFFLKERIDPTTTQIRRDERGLIIKKSGIFLKHYTGYTFRKEGHYEESIRQGEQRWIYQLRLPTGWEEDYSGILARLANPNLRLAVIVDSTIVNVETFSLGGIQGALVSIGSEPDDHGLLCRYECGVLLDTSKKEQTLDVEIIGCVETHKYHCRNWHVG
jgi:hypothetical protein